MGIPRARVETGQDSPRFHVHIEEGRGRGALTTLLVVPRESGALADALRELHDPAGPADLDARLGRMAATAPGGTGFIVALDDLAWVFPSEELRCRRLREGGSEALEVPQVVRLKPGDTLDMTGSDGAVLGRVHAEGSDSIAVPLSTDPHDDEGRRPGRQIAWRRVVSAGVAFGGAALLVAGFMWSRKPDDLATRGPRTDASVAPSLEDRIVDLVTGAPSQKRRAPDSAKPAATEDAMAKALAAETSKASMPPGSLADRAEEPGATIPADTATDAAIAVASDASGSVPHEPAGDGPHPWEFRAGGAITSSPFLSEGRVLFGSRDGKLYCLDAAGGDVAWAFAAGSGIGSSPCVQGKLCYVGTYAGEVLAVDLRSGKRAWRAKTRGRVVASPCVVAGAVIVGSYDSSVWAFDALTGERRWSVAMGAAVRASTEPVGDDAVVVCSTKGRVSCLSAASGKARWRHAMGGAVHAGAAYDPESKRVFVGTRDGVVSSLDAVSGGVAWTAKLGAAVNARPRVAGDLVLIGTGRGRLVALDRASGHKRWETQAAKGFDATPLVVGTKIVAASSDGTLHVLDAGTGEVRERRRLPSEVFTSPAASGGLVYLGTLRGTFHALALP